jgi:hypothetical protein
MGDQIPLFYVSLTFEALYGPVKPELLDRIGGRLAVYTPALTSDQTSGMFDVTLAVYNSRPEMAFMEAVERVSGALTGLGVAPAFQKGSVWNEGAYLRENPA